MDSDRLMSKKEFAMYKMKLIVFELFLIMSAVALVLSELPHLVKVAVLLLATLLVPGFISFNDIFISYKKYLELQDKECNGLD